MATYCVTFRLATMVIAGMDYEERRKALASNILMSGTAIWEDTTSFFFVETDLDLDTFAARVVRGLNADYDLVVVFKPDDMSGCYFGTSPDLATLRTFIRRLKKLP
jgi:hypothetical protein